MTTESEQPVSTVAADIENAVRDILKRHSVIRSTLIVLDWDLPDAAASQMPTCIFKTQRGTYAAEDIERMHRKTLSSLAFLAKKLVVWCQAVIEQIQQQASVVPAAADVDNPPPPAA